MSSNKRTGKSGGRELEDKFGISRLANDKNPKQVELTMFGRRRRVFDDIQWIS